jgi:formate dehydrogenase subunit delta
MSGTLDKLVYMANQIAREFENQRPREAVDATWDHLWHFWDPRTRAMIVAHLRAGGEGLGETAKAAVAKLGSPGEPDSQTKATEFNQAGDHESGRNLMSDAG